jgi:glycogen phosphorylase
MISDYTRRLYEPAHQAWQAIRSDNFRPAREKVQWNESVERAWPFVRIADASGGPGPCVLTGTPIRLEAALELGGLAPADVRVEAVIGRVNSDGALEETSVVTLPYVTRREGREIYGRNFVPHQTGRLGYTLRVCPEHCDDPLTRPVLPHVKWTRL